MRTYFTLACFLPLIAGCLSAHNTDPDRYFRPVVPAPPARTDAGRTITLRLGRISTVPYLGERMIWSLSDEEIAFDDTHRWVAEPSALVRDVFTGYFTPERGFRWTSSHESPTLDVRVVKFNGILDPPAAHLRIEFTIHRLSDLEVHVIDLKEPADATTPESLSRAMGAAIAAAALELTAWLREAIPDDSP